MTSISSSSTPTLPNVSASSTPGTTSLSGVRRGPNNDRNEITVPRNPRVRSVSSPIDETKSLSVPFTRMNQISVDTLTDPDIVEKRTNLMRTYLDAIILRVITPQKDSSNARIYSRGHNGKKVAEKVSYKRIYLCVVMASNLHKSQLFYIMQSQHYNIDIWNGNTEHRDNGIITVGSLIRFLSPSVVERFMQEIPLITFNSRAIALFPLSKYPSIAIENEIVGNSSAAFIYNYTLINVWNMRVQSTSCSGFHCDRQRVADWNTTGRGCGCFNNMPNHSNLAIILSVSFKSPDDQTRVMMDFSSKQFIHLCTNGSIPIDVRSSQLQATNAAFEMEDAIIKTVEYINNNGGWTIIGWYKRGIINDQSMIGMTEDGEQQKVDSGTVHFHIVSLLPSNRDFLNNSSDLGKALDNIKFNVRTISEFV